MARTTVYLVLVLLATSSLGQEVNPFIEAARSLLQESLAKNEGVASMVQGLLGSGAGKHIGDVLSGSKGIGDLLTDPQNAISVLGWYPTVGVGAPDFLPATGKAKASANWYQGNGDPSVNIKVLQNVMSSLSPNQMGDTGARSMGGGGGGGAALEGILGGLMPLLLQQGHEHHDEPELEDEAGHRHFDQMTSMFQPILAQVWDMFSKSEIGRGVWEESGLRETVDMFTDLRGKLKLEEALKSLENPQFRRRWLRSLVSFVANWVKHVSNPETHKRYMVSVALNMNSFLKSIGYKDKDLLHLGMPFEESLIHVLNTVLKGHLGITINSGAYIRPAARYFNELMQIGRASSMAMSREVEDRLAETLNKEVIEGVLRVWRAYKYALQFHRCDEYLLCELNRPSHHIGYVVRPGITKAASLVSAWFLSGQTGTAFWKLYNSAVEDYDCPRKFPVDCSGFHEEDIRVTTESAHNEL